MLSTFCGAFDVLHHKKEDKVVPAMVDIWEVLTHLIESCTPMHLNKSQNHGQKMLYSTFLHAF